MDNHVERLRHALGEAGAGVSWRLSDQQRQQLEALVLVHGVELLAAEAVQLAQRRGAPRSASAWLTSWRELPLPASAVLAERTLPAPCGACDGHLGGPRMLVDDAGRPTGPCPTCHPSQLGDF